MTQTIPLNKLILSPRNVRKSNGEEDIEGLADSIASKGLLQNLVVSPGTEGKIFEVDAGGRRWRALHLLVERKDLPRNWPVPVIVVPRDDALEASLAENLQKVAMNPADEVEAFAAIIDGYANGGPDDRIVDQSERIANCARRFGRTPNYVKQRLALAALAPEILEALRTGKITIECARAYATHPDHKVQIKVFGAEDRKGDWGHRPLAVKESLAGKIYPLDHKAVIYIGLHAYREAGGRIETDLFFGDEEREVLLDPSIVDRLARQKADLEAGEKAAAMGWSAGIVAPVSGPWYAEPRPGKGFEKAWGAAPEEASDETKAQSILGFRIAEDGRGLAMIDGYYFKPETARIAGSSPAVAQESYEVQLRRDRIELKAARLAAPKVSGTPLEGCAFWPADSSWDSADHDADGNALIELLVKVPKADVEAQLAEAERQIDEAERAAEADSAAEIERPQALTTEDPATEEPASIEPAASDQPEQVAA